LGANEDDGGVIRISLPTGNHPSIGKHVAVMLISASDYEKAGQFYLGRECDVASHEANGDLVLYDSKDLVTHGVVLGMTGSGKTGLCLALLEEAAMDNIPAIVIDPKGDIANLLLTFPDLDAKSFRPWINEDDAVKKGVGADQFAEQTAVLWSKGLGDWGQGSERIRAFRDKCDVNVFTPGSRAGIPVSILSSLAVPPFEVMDDGELLGERIESTVSSLLALVGVNADPIQSPEAVLLAAVFQKAWNEETDVTLESLVHLIQKPNFDKVGVIDLESFMPEKQRQSLSLRFNNLLASPGFSTWLEGPPLDIATMLHDPSGKPRISIFSISHLGDAERMFFTSLLLNQMLGWMRAQQGTTSLRALFYMDEIFGFLPPTANPPSKKPLMTMLKQGRAFGLGCLLATQNPVDLDYKALSNIGTWFLGRLQTERDKLRVLDGLEGAAGAQESGFDRSSMEKLLSGLGNRVFLMNNVHDDAPVLFHVRWVMSYLTGPLAKAQIKRLMDPKRDTFMVASPQTTTTNPMAMPAMGASQVGGNRPLVGRGVREWFSPGVEGHATYQPHLMRCGTVHFSFKKAGIDHSETICLVNPIREQGIDWDVAVPPPVDVDRLAESPQPGAAFGELPGYAMSAENFKQVEKDFAEWLYRNEKAEIFSCPALNSWGRVGETEGEFRTRLAHAAREARDAAVEKARDAAAKKIRMIETRLQTADGQLARQKAEANAANMQAGASVLGGLLGGLLGKKTRITTTRTTSALSKASSAYKQHQDVAGVQAKIAMLEKDIELIREELETELALVKAQYDPANLPLETEVLKPTRTDVKVQKVGLLWLA
jgi:hypothetical protein